MRRLQLQDQVVFPELNLIARGDVRVHLEPKAMEVLLELAKHPGEVVGKKQLLETVWGGVHVCEEVVTNAVSLLRRALGDLAKTPCVIQTIPKRGYRLIASVHSESSVDQYAPERSTGTPALPPNLRESILRARYLRHEETVPSLESARAYCEEIVRQEPNCAAAYAELALTLFLLEKLGVERRETIEPKVRDAIDCALRLDEHASMSLACLAKQEYRYDWKWEQADQHFQQATEAGPNEADVCVEFSIMLAVVRRFEESLCHAGRACSLDPISPAARLQAGHANYASGQWEAAAAHYRRVLRFTPRHVFARWGFADALTRAGRPQEGIGVLMEGLAMPGADSNPLLLTSLSRTRALLNPPGSGPRVALENEDHTNDPILLAELYGSLGEPAKAFRFLDEAADTRHYRLSAVNMFPQFEPLREDARYGRLLKRIGLRG
jgi:DNA-binding winged helix-turn-helix (wHTH) protein